MNSTTLRIQTEDFSVDEILNYYPVGDPPRRFFGLFDTELDNVRSRMRIGESYVKAVIVEGFYGMGKTLLVRRALLYAFRNHPDVMPIYIPFRKLALTREEELLNLAKSLNVKISGRNILPYALLKWFELHKEFLGSYGWSEGKTVTEVLKSREEVLKTIIQTAPTTFKNLIKTVNDLGFVPVVVLDEFEAFLLRGTRRYVLTAFEDAPSVMVDDVIVRLYEWFANPPNIYGVLVILTAIKMDESWVKETLKELATYPEDGTLITLLHHLRVEEKDYRRVTEGRTIDERLREAEILSKSYAGRFVLSDPAVRQRIMNYAVELKYKAGDYKELAKQVSIEPVVEEIFNYFEVMSLSMRTYVNILNQLRSAGVKRFDYEALSKVFSSGIDKCYELDTKLKNEKRIPSHAKWLKRTCGLLEHGLIALPVDVLPRPTIPPGDELKNFYDVVVKSLCTIFEIHPNKCQPWNPDAINKIRERLNSIRLQWQVVKMITTRKGSSIYVVDEAFIRWLLKDPYDLIGNEINIEEYVIQNIKKEKKE
ncbi:hypothetical protein Igag_0706 [Ignisphaera aggregans DSM 17230]|uniref:Uncharacterized protein n=1 Tax=Ignisphaera aggregans (strain DSM 17230 / JCM 13409 / AQ1.S1) TaxID=583356 RepID=E0SSY6_IGNAA|nr:hypothetical protein Igag_0706 [Ignisphaera aggregans DSM 17230]